MNPWHHRRYPALHLSTGVYDPDQFHRQIANQGCAVWAVDTGAALGWVAAEAERHGPANTEAFGLDPIVSRVLLAEGLSADGYERAASSLPHLD